MVECTAGAGGTTTATGMIMIVVVLVVRPYVQFGTCRTMGTATGHCVERGCHL